MIPTVNTFLNVGRTITFAGKEYPVRKPDQRQQAEFSARLEQRAREAAGRAHELPEETYEANVRAVTRDVAAFFYAVNGPGYLQALQTVEGSALLLYFTLRGEYPEVTEEFARGLIEADMRQNAVHFLKESLDPKVLTVVLAILGFPPDYLRSGSDTPSSGSPTPPSATAPGKSGD